MERPNPAAPAWPAFGHRRSGGERPGTEHVHVAADHYRFRPPTQAELEERICELERKLTVLTEAVTIMAQGLKGAPATGPDADDAANASRLAHELLIAARMAAKQDQAG